MSGRQTAGSSGPLQEYEKCIMQLMLSKGVLEEQELTAFLQEYQEKYNNRIDPLGTIFSRINIRMRHLSLEIRSVVQVDSDTNERSLCHGLVNVAEDKISKEFGSTLSIEESKLFSELCVNIYKSKRGLSTSDVYNETQGVKMSKSMLAATLEKLEGLGWLRRSSRSYWELGPKSMLELRTFVESALSDDEPSSSAAGGGGGVASKWPQIVMY